MASDLDRGVSLNLGGEFRLLCDLGMTPIQSKVYLMLQKKAGLSARNIGDALNINRADIYRALEHLQDAGLIDVILGNPNKYVAVEPRVAVDLLLTKMEDDFDSLRRSARGLIKSLEARQRDVTGLQTPVGGGQFFKLKSGSAVVSSIFDMVRSAQTDVMKVVTRRALNFHALYGLLDHERRLAKKGVKIRIITDAPSASLEEYVKIAKFHYAGDLTSALRYVIVDDRMLMLSLAANAKGPTDSMGLLTNNNTLVNALTNHFEETWTDTSG
jgi:sugar-specific transcriptional regulator TrmB